MGGNLFQREDDPHINQSWMAFFSQTELKKKNKSIKCLHGLTNILGMPKLSVCVANAVLHLIGYM